MIKYHVRRWILLALRKADPTPRDRLVKRWAIRRGWISDDMRYDWHMTL